MEVEIISRECIKPSSPTPIHLKTYHISLLDQFEPRVYAANLLFYPPNKANSISETSRLLKKSLSKTLTLYYPLAGKAKDSLSIDCNDEGACYISARVNCDLSDCLKQPTSSTLPNFLPSGIYSTELTSGAHVIVIQETLFSCGCIAIAFLFSHSILDATASSGFLKTWATIARQPSTGVNLSPNFSASSIFPQTSDAFPEDLTVVNLTSFYHRNGKFVGKRFVFDGSVITKLKAKTMSSGVQNPTRVEVVFAVFLKCIISALRVKSGKQKSALAITTVNLRRKAVPPIPDTAVGNFAWLAPIVPQVGDTGELCDIVHRIRESMSHINGEFVKSLEGDGGFNFFCESLNEIGKLCSKALSEGAVPIQLNSWCNMGFYEFDFGWGKPLWVPFLLGEPPNASFITLMDTRQGNGIEACVVLDEETMTMLEHHMELRSLVSVDPNPLQIGLLSSNL
ncbi:stemmadenine O-acetyltransferase-like [Tripterygium wilfordii]|uniref:stemmadenine O-acetyltransferase-like n=1 Tax=Tripterygium wilfordii TaxID=458696 RepID=UPI0018F83A29|nr:stemmadenine O-acetyltransferase-like [Tripterygium wilfordii]